jgi:hypothetical protein
MTSRLVNKTRRCRLYIGGTDYTSKLISWQVSDSSANKNGIIQTQGELILGEIIGGNSLEDYDRNLFKRGTEVVLDVYKPDSNTAYRHPRGLLYVISTGYSPESSSLSVQLGCKLVLAALTEDISEILPLVPIQLEEDRLDYGNCSAAFLSYGKVLYQNNSGSLVVRKFFDGDGYGTAASGLWTTVIGQSTLSVEPMLGGNAIPDSLELTYQVPVNGIDPTAITYEKTETISKYPIEYPGFAFERINTGTGLGESNTTTTSGSSSSSCGNAPGTPATALGLPSCTEGYQTAEYSPLVDVKSLEQNESWYDGPAGQISRSLSRQWGPGIEINSQYYADKYAYCKYTYATACNPTGSCPFYGADGDEDFVEKAYSQTLYYYGDANELVQTVKDEYQSQLALAKDSDWRSGIEEGIPKDYRTIAVDTFIHTQRVVTEYSQVSGNVNRTLETTYNSPARDVGLRLSQSVLSALGANAIKSTKKTLSTKITALPLTPEITKTPQVATEDRSAEYPIFTSTYTGPSVAGPYVIKEAIPVPVLFETEAEVLEVVSTYSDYLIRFIKGDSYGVTVGEALRGVVIDSWYPGMPFYLCDAEKGKILSLRMDATSWGVDGQEAIFVTQGIWIGDSLGTLSMSSNLVGNTLPVIPDEPIPSDPPAPVEDPVVNNGGNVNNGPLTFPVIEIHCGTEITVTQPDGTGIISVFPPYYVDIQLSTTVFITGFTLQPGNLLTLLSGGSIPVSGNGNNLITGNPVIIDPDLFAA